MRLSYLMPLTIAAIALTVAVIVVEAICRLWMPGPQLTINAPDQRVLVGFSPNNELLVTAGCYLQDLSDEGFLGGPVRLWDTKTGHQRAVLSQGKRGVVPIQFSPDSRLLTVAVHPGSLELWDVVEGQCVLRCPSPHTAVLSSTSLVNFTWKSPQPIAFSPLGDTLAFWEQTSRGEGEDHGRLHLWDTSTHRVRATLEGAAGAVSFAPNGKTLATGAIDGGVKLWDVDSGQELGRLAGPVGLVATLTFSADGHLLLSGHGPRTLLDYDAIETGAPKPAEVVVWDFRTRSRTSAIAWTHIGDPAFAAGNKCVIVGAHDLPGQPVACWRIEPRGTQPELLDVWLSQHRAVSPDGRSAAILDATATSPTVRLIATDSLQQTALIMLGEMAMPGLGVPRIEFTPDRRYLLVAQKGWRNAGRSLDSLPEGLDHREAGPLQTLRVYDASTGERKALLRASGSEIKCSPDARLAATMTDRGLIRIWNIPPRKPSRFLIALGILALAAPFVAGYWWLRRRWRKKAVQPAAA
jgi:WD40 repeat protein